MGRSKKEYNSNSAYNKKNKDTIKKSDIRSKKGDGYMRFVKSRNQFVFTFRYTDCYGQRKSKTVYGNSEAVCKEKSEEFLASLTHSTSFADLTIPELVRKHLDTRYALNDINTGYQRQLDTLKIIEQNQGFSSMKIRDITVQSIYAFFANGICDNYSQSVVKKLTQMISKALDMAIEDGSMPTTINPMKRKDFIRPKSSKPTKKIRAFTTAERLVLINAVQNYKPKSNARDFRLPILIALFTGLRMGEVLALKKQDINMFNMTLTVNKTIARGLDYIPFLKDTPKTEAGNRTIPLSNLALDVLKSALELSVDNKDNLIFYNYEKSRPISTSEVNQVLKTIEKCADLPQYSTHSLRHTFASHALKSGISVAVIRDWLGHSSIETTVNTYCDILQELAEESINRLNDSNNGVELNVSFKVA